MSKLPAKILKELKEEAEKLDKEIGIENSQKTKQLLSEAKLFKTARPPREPVSLRIDPYDISMIKRLARKKGLPPTQLMSMWLHERVEEERTQT
jgi:predicted DNA binding CopG/RHH family protein